MATKVIEELNQVSKNTLLYSGMLFILFIISSYLFFKQDYQSSDSIKFDAVFKSIDGINYESPITVSGVKVGYISNIILNLDNSVTVEGIIDQATKITSDSILKIDTNGIFGKKYFSIVNGYDDYFINNDITFLYTSDSYTIDYLARILEK